MAQKQNSEEKGGLDPENVTYSGDLNHHFSPFPPFYQG